VPRTTSLLQRRLKRVRRRYPLWLARLASLRNVKHLPPMMPLPVRQAHLHRRTL